ncbi:MAG: hypothetical protein U0841_22580 [Chloroflexia bacterium]
MDAEIEVGMRTRERNGVVKPGRGRHQRRAAHQAAPEGADDPGVGARRQPEVVRVEDGNPPLTHRISHSADV